MSREGFRFVHASGLRLDEPLAGTGPLAPEDRAVAEEGTFRAWDGVVEICRSAQADFLLLTGDCFRAATDSLRGQIALEKGFEKLAAHQVPVYVVPGLLDPPPAWKRSLHLPPNVSLIVDEHQDPVAVLRGQRVLASVFAVATPNAGPDGWRASERGGFDQHRTPFRIGVVPAGTPIRWQSGKLVTTEQPGVVPAAVKRVQSALDQRVEYIALGEGTPRSERFPGSIAHDPGCVQSLTRWGTGPRGCSLVDVSPAGEIRIDALAAAPVRWEEMTVKIERHCRREEAVERMALAVLDRKVEEAERLWIIHWCLSGEGTFFESLSEASSQNELWERLEAELEGEGSVRRVHRLHRVGRGRPDGDVRESEAGLLPEFHEIISGSEDLLESVRRELLESRGPGVEEGGIVRELIEKTPDRKLVQQARMLADEWLG